MNSYLSILQTTKYNSTITTNIGKICAGVVRAAGVYPKNAVQHAADLAMLKKEEKVKTAFTSPLTGKPELIECIYVDGAADKGQHIWRFNSGGLFTMLNDPR